MTDEHAVRLLRPLQGEPDGPSRIDVARAMAEGRRRRALRRWSSGVALAAVTSVTAAGGTLAMSAVRQHTPVPAPTVTGSVAPSAAAPSAAAAAPAGPADCKVTRLPTGEVRKALVTAGDPSGRYLAGRIYRSAISTVIWKDGKILAMPQLSGGDPSFNDITSSGVAVGSKYIGERQQAYVLQDGRLSELNGLHTEARAINEAGVVVGSIGEVLSEVPARWSSTRAEVARLPLPAGYRDGVAVGIAEDGTVVGSISRGGTDVNTGYLWGPDGAGVPMPLPTVRGVPATAFWPESIVNGWVAGRAVFDEQSDGSRRFESMRYRIADRSYQSLPVNSTPALLADNGWVLTGLIEAPVVVSGSEVTELPRYRTLKEYEISSFSADGRVAAGYTTDSNEEGVGNEPLLWTCR